MFICDLESASLHGLLVQLPGMCEWPPFEDRHLQEPPHWDSSLHGCALIPESGCLKYFSKPGAERESFEISVNYFERTKQGKEHPECLGQLLPQFSPRDRESGPWVREQHVLLLANGCAGCPARPADGN